MKVLISILSTFTIFSSLLAQNPGVFNAEENKILGKISNDAIYILRQDYHMVDTTVNGGRRYGRNELDYFGRFYFVAIAVNGKFIVDKGINSPWETDTNYIKFNKYKKYKPELSDLAFKKIGDKKFTMLNPSDSLRYNRLNPFCKIKYKDSLTSFPVYNFLDSLPIDSAAYFWLADIISDEKNDDINIQFESSKGKYSPTKDAFINNKFYYSDNSKAGFIFCTKPEFGAIKYFLCGIIIKNQGKFTFISIKNDQILDKLSIKKDFIQDKNSSNSSLREIPNKQESADKKSSKKKKRKG